jgi:hypothetical protein
MNEQVDPAITNHLERLHTPRQLADRRILSLVTQWKMRKNGRLKFYQIGTKILYSDRHIQDFLSLCESPRLSFPAAKKQRKTGFE